MFDETEYFQEVRDGYFDGRSELKCPDCQEWVSREDWTFSEVGACETCGCHPVMTHNDWDCYIDMIYDDRYEYR